MDRTFDGNQYVRDLNKAWNAKDPAGFLAHSADNVDFKDPLMSESVQGKEAAQEALRKWVEAIGEVHFRLVESVESDNHVALLMRLSGKHVGDLVFPGGQRVKATDREFVMQVVELLVLNEQGLVVSSRPLFDPNVLLDQLGVKADMLQAPAR